MRITVFGATGRTGRLVLDQARARGLDVTALARDPSFLMSDPSLRIVKGDATNADAVKSALEEADAAISVMAIPEGTEETTALSDATRKIARRMAMTGPRRVLITTNAAIFHDREVADPYRIVAAEHRRNVAMLRGSDLSWTVLAAPYLVDGAGTGKYEAVIEGPPPGKKIPRSDLALALLDGLSFDDWVRRAVGVSEPIEE
jgi:putative NADH-flavin reductase